MANLIQDFDGPPLVIQGLNKRYDGRIWANRDVNFTIEKGEILGILGPNGAGKTTLVRQITTELLPTSGNVHVLGHDVVTEPSTVKNFLGIMPQEVTPIGYLTVYKHLQIFGKLRGLPPQMAANRAEELVADLGLSAHRNQPVDKLSGGLKRRVLIGIAALANPPLMVLDEPTTGLDPRSRRDLWSQLRRYREQGTSILITTHSMEEAEALCDRVGIMKDARLLALDTIAKLKAQHIPEFKITYLPSGSSNEPVTLYGDDLPTLEEQVREKLPQQFTLAPTNLEDVYLAMTGETKGFDDDSD